MVIIAVSQVFESFFVRTPHNFERANGRSGLKVFSYSNNAGVIKNWKIFVRVGHSLLVWN